MPTFPIPVTGPGNIDPEVQGNVGPFQMGSNLYLILQDATTGEISVWKSADNGNTWTQKDAAHDVTGVISPVSSVLVGTILYVVSVDVATHNAQVSQFQTASDTWTTTVINGSSYNWWIGIGIGLWQVVYRPSDAMLIFTINQWVVVGSTFANYYVLYDTGANTFAAPVQIASIYPYPSHGLQISGVLRANLYTYFFFADVDTNQVIQIPWSDGGAVGSQQVITTLGFPINGFLMAASDGAVMTIGNIQIPSATQFTVFTATGGSAAPIWGSRTVIQAVAGQDIAIARGAGVTSVALVAGTGPYTFLYYTDFGSGFGSPTVIGSAVSLSGILKANSVSAGVGIVFTGSTLFWLFSPFSSPGVVSPIDSSALQYVNVSAGTYCRFDRDLRPSLSGPRTIVIGKTMTYPEGFVRG